MIERGLLRKGFLRADTHHRRFTYYRLDGMETELSTFMSHGSDRDVSDGMLAAMARQLRLNRRQFDQLIDCGLSQSDYEAMMRRDGFIR